MNFNRTRFLISVLTASPGVLFVYSPLLVVQSLASIAIPFATGRLVDSLAYSRLSCATFALLSTLLLLQTLLSPLLQRLVCSRSRILETDLQFRLLSATMALAPARLAGIQDGQLVAKLSRDTYAIGGFLRGLYSRLLQATVMMFAAGFALYTRSPVLALAFMAFFPLAIFLFAPFARRFASNSHHVRQQSETSFCTLFNFLMTLPLLRTLDAERRFAETPMSALQQLKRGNDESDALSVRFGFLLGTLLVVGEIAVIGIASTFAAKGVIPVGDVVLYQMLFITAIQSIQGVISLLPEFSALRESADSLGEALNHTSVPNGHLRIAHPVELSFHHVTFAYPGAANRPVLRDFSARFYTGTVVGLSGANGSGKSTLLKLAVNALEPQEGEIRLDDHPFADIDLDDFRRRIGIVFQDNLLVTGTIRDNITLRDPAFTQADIDQALTLSGFGAVVARLPEGLDTLVGNNLRTLSGGERQRLAIARAIIRDPMILILDEATNHLDAKSRHDLANLITHLRPGRLILIAGHDAELEKMCDTKISCQIS